MFNLCIGCLFNSNSIGVKSYRLGGPWPVNPPLVTNKVVSYKKTCSTERWMHASTKKLFQDCQDATCAKFQLKRNH